MTFCYFQAFCASVDLGVLLSEFPFQSVSSIDHGEISIFDCLSVSCVFPKTEIVQNKVAVDDTKADDAKGRKE